MMGVTETHLKGNEKITIEKYQYVGLNRRLTVQRGCGSGGIGILYKVDLLKNYKVDSCFECYDNVLGLKFTNKEDMECYFVVYIVYLPPEQSRHAIHNESILNQLSLELYKHCEAEHVIICGDFNARVGDRDDCQYVDGIPKRTSIDAVINQQGLKFLTFVNDIKGCIINGRVDVDCDDFPSITSYKGRSVVDYYVCRQIDLDAIKSLRVESCTHLINQNNWMHLIQEHHSIPDHNLLSMTVEMSSTIQEGMQHVNIGYKSYQKKKVYRKVGDDYMNSETAVRLIPDRLEEIGNLTSCQQEIDDMYLHLTELILSEAELSLANKSTKRQETKYKPYWN